MTSKILLSFLFAIFATTHGGAICNQLIDIDARNSTVYLNCGNGEQKIIKGENNIKDFLSEISRDTEKLIGLSEQEKNNDKIVVKYLEIIKDNLKLVHAISAKMLNLQENAKNITTSAIKNLIYRGFFFEASTILEENKKQPGLEQLRVKVYRLHKFLTNSDKYLETGNYVLSLRYADSIKIVGDTLVDNFFTKKLTRTILDEFLEVAENEIISKFDDINCRECIIQDTRNPKYLEIYDKFSQAYNFKLSKSAKPDDYSKWHDTDLKWFVNYSSDSALKRVHSEVFYKMCFMLHHDFADIHEKRVKPWRQWLTNMIGMSIKLNQVQSQLEKKYDLQKSINR